MRRLLPALALLALLVGAVLTIPPTADAWPAPDVDAYGAACDGGERTPLEWVITNRESGHARSPASVTATVDPPEFGLTDFEPQPIPNTGDSTASSVTEVPPDYAGPVTLSYTMTWDGPDGHDKKHGEFTVTVRKCEAPTTTTTTTLAPTTSTTTPPTTATTAPTSSSTVPDTTSSTNAPPPSTSPLSTDAPTIGPPTAAAPSPPAPVERSQPNYTG